MTADDWVTAYWIGAALTAVFFTVGTVRLVRETGDPGLAIVGVLIVFIWPLVMPLYLVSLGCEWFVGWLRVRTGHSWPWPFGRIEYPDRSPSWPPDWDTERISDRHPRS